MAEYPAHFADRLLAKIDEKGSPVCVGLDPVYERLPDELRQADALAEYRIEAIEEFCLAVIDLVAPIVPAVKVQSACFERYGAEGVAVYYRTVDAADAASLRVIGDVKRGDIGSTAVAYADGHLRSLTDDGDYRLWNWAPDAITVNGYFGTDGLLPFIEAARGEGAGLFVMVRTSNPGGAAVQDFQGSDGKPFYVHMAEQVAALGEGEGLVGESGYSLVGAVVGATYPDEARRLRKIMPRQIFLVPGYGAQGATAADCAAAFDADGRGAIVNASRSVIYAFADRPDLAWQEAVERAARAFARDIAAAVGG